MPSARLVTIGGTRVRVTGEWTIRKFHFLREYLPAFTTATKSAIHRIYVDVFAGPGRVKVTRPSGPTVEDGSPLIAAHTTPPLTDCHYIELDPQCAAALRANTAGIATPRIHIYEGDANVLISQVLDEIPDQAPCFYLLDPEGTELHWETVAKIGAKPKGDVLINVPLGFLKRLMPAKQGEPIAGEAIDQFFGTPEWRDIYARWQRGEISNDVRPYLDLYKRRLTALGFQHVPWEVLVTNTRKVPMYYLIFVAKSDLPIRIATSILKRDPFGQQRLF